MACIKYILDLADDYPSGGVWTYVGFNSSSAVGPFTSTAANPLVPFSNGAVITYGDNFPLDPTNKTEGFYQFSYSLSGNLVIHVIDEAGCTGQDTLVQFDDSDGTTYDLEDFIASFDCPTVTGTWDDVDATGASLPNIVPSDLGVGTYQFDLSLLTLPAADCTECEALKSSIYVTVTDQFGARLLSANSSCAYTLSLQNDDTATANQLRVTVDGTDVIFSYDKNVDICGTPVLIPGSQIAPKLGTGASVTFNESGHFTSITLTNAAGGTVVIPCAPYTATLTGTYGTVLQNSLYFQVAAPQIFCAALEIVINNYLDDQGYTLGTDYDIVNIDYDITGTVSVYFACKNSPSGDWLGLQAATPSFSYQVDKGSSPVSQSIDEEYYPTYTLIAVYSDSPCPSLLKTSQTISLGSVVSSLDYDTITVGGTYSYTDTDSETCGEYTLTVVDFNCGGTTTYLWSTGATSSSIAVTSGSYSVDVTCSGTTITLSINIP